MLRPCVSPPALRSPDCQGRCRARRRGRPRARRASPGSACGGAGAVERRRGSGAGSKPPARARGCGCGRAANDGHARCAAAASACSMALCRRSVIEASPELCASAAAVRSLTLLSGRGRAAARLARRGAATAGPRAAAPPAAARRRPGAWARAPRARARPRCRGHAQPPLLPSSLLGCANIAPCTQRARGISADGGLPARMHACRARRCGAASMGRSAGTGRRLADGAHIPFALSASSSAAVSSARGLRRPLLTIPCAAGRALSCVQSLGQCEGCPFSSPAHERRLPWAAGPALRLQAYSIGRQPAAPAKLPALNGPAPLPLVAIRDRLDIFLRRARTLWRSSRPRLLGAARCWRCAAVAFAELLRAPCAMQ